MKDIRELKCKCGATWENLMWLKYDDVDVEGGEIFVTESYECLECEEVIHVEHIATVKRIEEIK